MRLALEVEDIVLLGSAANHSGSLNNSAHTVRQSMSMSMGRSGMLGDVSSHSAKTTPSRSSRAPSYSDLHRPAASTNTGGQGVLWSLVHPTVIQTALIIEQLAMLQYRRREVTRCV